MPDVFDYADLDTKADAEKSRQAAEFKRLGVAPPAEANIDIFDQASAATKAPAKKEVPKEQAGSQLDQMRKRLGMETGKHDFTGLASTGASLVGSALAPETGMLSLLIPALMAGGTASGISALKGEKDPLMTGLTTGVGDIGGGAVGKGAGWLGGKLASKFELGKYIGKVGSQLSEVFHLPPMKTTQDIYNALHLGKAEEAIGEAYRGAKEKIFSVVSPDTPIKGTPAKFLNKIYYDHVPEYRSVVDAVVANSGANRPGGFVSKYSSFKKMPKQEEQNLLNQALETMPITVENAMEYAKLLGAYSSAGKQAGARGFSTREANRDARETISRVLDDLKPGAGQLYTAMNMDFRRGMTTLSAFEDRALFKETRQGPVFNRVEWQKASNDALKKLHEVGLDHLDETIRLGRQPGATGAVIGAHGRIGSPGIKWFHPGTWMQVNMENPLRGESKIPNELIRKLLKGAPGAAGADVGAELGE